MPALGLRVPVVEWQRQEHRAGRSLHRLGVGPHEGGGDVLCLAALLVMAVLAPLVEELVFRGLLYGWLEGRWGSAVAFIVSSLAFAAAHYEWKHIVLVLPLGLLFGYLRRRTNSLVPSLAAHMVNNGFAVVAAAFLAP